MDDSMYTLLFFRHGYCGQRTQLLQREAHQGGILIVFPSQKRYQMRAYIKCLDLQTPSVRPSAETQEADNIPKISPQIDNLPRPQRHKHAHRPKRKPFHPLVRTLVRIPQLLFPRPQIFHLGYNLLYQFFDASEFRLDGFEFFLGLDGGPVAGVGADVDVEFDVAGWVQYCA